MGVRVYFERPVWADKVWSDALATSHELFERKFSRFRYMLIDVGIQRMITRFGRLEYPQWWLDKYRTLCQSFMETFEGRVRALIPDFPPDWRGVKVPRFRERHYELLRGWGGDEYSGWVPILRYEGLGLSEIGAHVEEVAELFDPYETLAVPSLLGTSYRAPVIEAVRQVRRVLPTKKVHLLAPSIVIIRLLPRGSIDSLDLGQAMASIRLLKSNFARFTGMGSADAATLKSVRFDRHSFTNTYLVVAETIIREVERNIGEVDYAGFVPIR